MPLYALHLKVPMNLKNFATFDAMNAVARLVADPSTALKHW
jgi:hypothetical protein